MPHPRVVRVGSWVFGSGSEVVAVPKGLKRYYGRGDLHFLTFSRVFVVTALSRVGCGEHDGEQNEIRKLHG